MIILSQLKKIAPKGDHKSQRMLEDLQSSSEKDLEPEDQTDAPAVLVDPYGLLARWQMKQETGDHKGS